MFEALLIANRGEIAVRIIRACRELGVRSIAVFSEADRFAPHVFEADEAHPIGAAPSAESYLNADRILDVAARRSAQAIHPGYGFLSEQAAFSRAVIDAGFTFVGPSTETIATMGDKTEARRRMQEVGVPVVPGGTRPATDPEDATAMAEDLGYPLLLKAAAGGGGKGMRLVMAPAELAPSFAAAQREAQAAFGDGTIYLERFLERPRHIEIQLLGDTHGNLVHLGERECSIQRRHQKLVEEAPSCGLTPALRASMAVTALKAAKAVDYVGAGTVEFLLEGEAFYFLEMNARLQVEHPVTEMVTGIDLVQWQIRVACGEPLDFDQDDVAITGHAIECRITSEDSRRGFLPSTGRISCLELPSGPGVRWDGGIREGYEIGLHYDPLLAKLIVHARSREDAIRRMARALDELVVTGVDTGAPFHRRLMADPDFVDGNLSIRFVEEHPRLLDGPADEDFTAALVAVALLEHDHRQHHQIPRVGDNGAHTLSGWQKAGWPWRQE
ncbi:MAG: hypothetical protein BMS9Abin29_2043 [Gemmatimonadota bacterium]|nr:MAG: hypothetical protein BMS9Abin29_2043 [Gemmatimonadota bacterium]